MRRRRGAFCFVFFFTTPRVCFEILGVSCFQTGSQPKYLLPFSVSPIAFRRFVSVTTPSHASSHFFDLFFSGTDWGFAQPDAPLPPTSVCPMATAQSYFQHGCFVEVLFQQAHKEALSGAHRALCPRCAKSRLFSSTGSHGSQGHEFCTLQPLLVHQGFFF